MYYKRRKKMSTVTLLIMAKASWQGGFCYLGYNPASRLILRPVIKSPPSGGEKPSPIPKDKELYVGLWYEFQLRKDNLFCLLNNNFPHINNDMSVETNMTRIPPPRPLRMLLASYDYYGVSPLYATLLPLSNSDIREIFDPSLVVDGRYLIAGTDCPSLGILRCRIGRLTTGSHKGSEDKFRIQIDDVKATFPFTADNAMELIDNINTYHPPDEPVLVLFSVTRPFTGKSPEVQFNPPRCYILVVGLVTKYLPSPFYQGLY